MAGTKGVRLEPLSDPPSTSAREEAMARGAGGATGTAVSRPARLTSLQPKAAVQRYMQDHKVAELMHDVTGDLILAKPANPARFICDWMSGLLGPAEADSQEASGGCFLRVHVECGLPGQRVREHFSRKAPVKVFTVGVMRGWRREASEVLAGVVASVLGDGAAEGNGPAAGKSLDDEMRALKDRVREVEEELREARAEVEKAGVVVAVLRARLAQAEADFKGGACEDASGEAAKGWEATEELRGKLQEVFEQMDLNKDGAVDADERAKTSGLLNALHMEYGLRTVVAFEGALTYEAFEAVHVREWEVARKEQALAGVNVLRAVAEQLPGGSPETPLEHLEGMSGEDLLRFCRRRVAAGVEDLLRKQQEVLREGRRQGDGDKIAEQGNSKFAQGGEVLREAQFGTMEDFTTGLVGKIGLPNPRLMEAMTWEHCMRGDSKVSFSPGNYDTTTTPEAEWRVVTHPKEGTRVSVGARRVRALEDLLLDPRATDAGLREEEILALQLYTGWSLTRSVSLLVLRCSREESD
ncbi:hypothetical protein T484DRAFT_2707359 [Baffinella frigidus]|nr:hypothetical protein T484DRAFT_2707359 [Cryptophyta sp. CCMP2293]